MWRATNFLLVRAFVFIFLALNYFLEYVPVSVLQGVYGLLKLTARWTDIDNHYGFAISPQRIL